MTNENEFFGREGELEALQDAYESRRAEMAIVYGRRRIGKTALLNKFCKGKRALYYTAMAWKDPLQLDAFSQAVGEFTGNVGQRFLTWRSALKCVASAYPDERTVLVIDEFQYIAQEREGILSEIQVAWDEELSKENFLLILCGSAVSFIAKEVLGQKNPLYGRARTIMKVGPLSFTQAARFVPNYSAEDAFVGYAALGGVPYYWQTIDSDRSVRENLAADFFRPTGLLSDEVQSVLRQEFRDAANYNAILKAIAFGATARNEISQKSLVDSRTLTKYLSVLEGMELIEHEFPVFAGKREHGNTARGLYRIADPCLRFWFRFLANGSSIASTRREAQIVWNEKVEPHFLEFASLSFEEVCRQYLLRLRFSGELPLIPDQLGRWWNDKQEIDLVATDAERKNCIAAECKYRNEKTGFKVLRSLQVKVAHLPLADDAVVYYWLFSRSGFDDALKAEAALNPRIRLIGMDDLFSARQTDIKNCC